MISSHMLGTRQSSKLFVVQVATDTVWEFK